MRLFIPGKNNAALRIVGIYLLVGSLWILLSDSVVELLLPNTHLGHVAQTVKGLAYVGVTGALLWWLIMRYREQLGRQAYQAQRMELVGRMAGGVAHDFNNLLSAAIGLCSLLEEDAQTGEVAATDVAELRGILKRGAELAARLLAIGRREPAPVQRFDVSAAVRDGERLWQRAAGLQNEVVLDLAEELPPVVMAALQFDQIVLNLVLNARDAMPQGGRLDIRTEPRAVSELQARTLQVPAGLYVSLSVADSGVGMDAAALKRLFEPFYSSKPDGEGFGLGLASVEVIVHSAGGAIAVASTPGQGTTFDIYLPAAPAD